MGPHRGATDERETTQDDHALARSSHRNLQASEADPVPAPRCRRSSGRVRQAVHRHRGPNREVDPSRWFSRALRGSCRKQNAASQQVEAGSAVALTLQQLEAVDLSLGLSAAPGFSERGAHRGAVLLQPGGKGLDCGDAACTGLGQPPLQLRHRLGWSIAGPPALVPYVRPLHGAQSSMPTMRGASCSGGGRRRIRRSTVSALVGMARQRSKPAPASPPSATPTRPWVSASRHVRRAQGLTRSGKRSAKV